MNNQVEVISKPVPPIPYKKPTAKNFLVTLKRTKPVPPRAFNRVSAITRLMQAKQQARRREISDLRMAGKI